MKKHPKQPPRQPQPQSQPSSIVQPEAHAIRGPGEDDDEEEQERREGQEPTEQQGQEPKEQPGQDEFVDILPIRVRLLTNVGTHHYQRPPQQQQQQQQQQHDNTIGDFTFSMLAHEPSLASIRATIKGDHYPYFAINRPFPKATLMAMSFLERVRFFFDRRVMEGVLSQVKPQANVAYANAMLMLSLLLPLDDSKNGLLSSSFEFDFEYRVGTTWLDTFWRSLNHIQPPAFRMRWKDKFYRIVSVKWINDLVNHPVYLEFLRTYKENEKLQDTYKRRLDQDLNDRRKALLDRIRKRFSRDDNKVPAFIDGLRSQNEVHRTSVLDRDRNRSRQEEQRSAQFAELLVALQKALEHALPITAKTEKVNALASALVALNTFLQLRTRRITYLANDSQMAEYTSLIDSDTRSLLQEWTSKALTIKAGARVREFLEGKRQVLDISERYSDNTTKPPDELAIVREMQTNFATYVQFSAKKSRAWQGVSLPTRKSSNDALQKAIRRFVTSEASPHANKGFDVGAIYDRYVLGRATNRSNIPLRLLNVGVSTITGNIERYDRPVYDGYQQRYPENHVRKELFEIYVAIDMVNDVLYTKTANAACKLADNMIRNQFQKNMFQPTYSLPSHFREIDLLPNNTNTSTTSTTAAASGGARSRTSESPCPQSRRSRRPHRRRQETRRWKN